MDETVQRTVAFRDVLERIAKRANALQANAKLVGMTENEISEACERGGGNPSVRLDELEKEIALRMQKSPDRYFIGKVMSWYARRKKLAGAYIAGASLSQLGAYEGTTSSGIHNLVNREISQALKQQLAAERIGRKSKLTYEQVGIMLHSVSFDDCEKLPVPVLAAKMREALAPASQSVEKPLPSKSPPEMRSEEQREGTLRVEKDLIHMGMEHLLNLEATPDVRSDLPSHESQADLRSDAGDGGGQGDPELHADNQPSGERKV